MKRGIAWVVVIVAHAVAGGPHDHWWGSSTCYPSDPRGVQFPIGIALSHRAQQKYTITDVENIMKDVNAVFVGQLNVHLHLEEFHAAPGKEVYDMAECGDPQATLDAFSAWASNKNHEALWHLIDDCFPEDCVGGCIAGITYTANRPCVAGRNTAMTYITGLTWSTVAHELGHNFGADHSFDKGVGKTGGLMDYYNITYLGLPQFNAEYARDELCEGVEESVLACDAILQDSPHYQTPHSHPHQEIVAVRYVHSTGFALWTLLWIALGLTAVSSLVFCVSF